MIRLLSWNMAHRDLWAQAVATDGVDVALLQEAVPPPAGVVEQVLPGADGSWSTAGWPRRHWRTAVARVSPAVELTDRPAHALAEATDQTAWAVSQPGTITAADVVVDGEVRFTVASVYAPWERTAGGGLYADASAHRVLSDLSALTYSRRHRVVVAGDWNILLGYGEHGDEQWGRRYASVFARAAVVGLRYVGPAFPNGRRADPWPEELPEGSLCVPTYHHSRQTPATATRQLDFVFASESIADSVSVRTLNGVEEWGGSDHCRVLVDVDV